MFTQFEEGNILTETRNDAENRDKSDNESIMMSKQDMENLNENEKSHHHIITTKTLEGIRDGNQTRPTVNKREASFKKRDCIKQRQSELKGALKTISNTGKGLHRNKLAM